MNHRSGLHKNEAALEVSLKSSMSSAINYSIRRAKASLGKSDNHPKGASTLLVAEVECKHRLQSSIGRRGLFGSCVVMLKSMDSGDRLSGFNSFFFPFIYFIVQLQLSQFSPRFSPLPPSPLP